MVFNNPAVSAIILFIVFTVIIIITKPSFIYDYRNKKFKDFGFGKYKTIMPLPILCIFVGIFSYGVFYYFSSPIQKAGSQYTTPQYFPQQLLRYPYPQKNIPVSYQGYYNPQQFISANIPFREQAFMPEFE